MLRRVRALASLVALGLLSCDRTAPTPAGTTLIHLPAIVNGALQVASAKGPFTKKSGTYRVKGTHTGGVRIRVEFEHGPVDRSPATPLTAPTPLLAFRDFKVSVLENALWEMSATCHDPTIFDDTAEHSSTVTMSCVLTMRRKNGSLSHALRIHVSGTGRYTVTAPSGGDYAVMADP